MLKIIVFSKYSLNSSYLCTYDYLFVDNIKESLNINWKNVHSQSHSMYDCWFFIFFIFLSIYLLYGVSMMANTDSMIIRLICVSLKRYNWIELRGWCISDFQKLMTGWHANIVMGALVFSIENFIAKVTLQNPHFNVTWHLLWGKFL